MTVKISNLPAATSVGSGDVIPVVQSGTTKKIDLNSPWNINIDGGNIDGTPIGVSSASSGAFTTLSATNDVTIADKIIHAGDTNTAIRFPSADTVTFETSGTEAMRIDSSGNVGISTSSPVYLIDTGFNQLSSSNNDVKSTQRIGNVVQVKRKVSRSSTDRVIFKLKTTETSFSGQGAWEITIFASGGEAGVSGNRQRVAKYLVSRNSSGTFATTSIAEIGSASAAFSLNGVADGLEIILVGASSPGMTEGGVFLEVKGIMGTENFGAIERQWEIETPTL